jgi:outer membrane protein assembly factor BamB
VGRLLLLLLVASAAAEDWPCARFDPQNTGASGNRGPVKTPSVAWKREEKDAISPGVALAAGRLVYGVGEFVVACRDAAGGREVWDAPVKQQVAAWPSIRGELAYVGSPDRVHYILKMADGKEAGASEATDAIVADPVVTDEHYLAGATDGVFYVMSPKNGSVLWRVKTGPVRRGCAVERGVAYVANEEGTLFALDLGKKRELWRYDARAAPLCAPVVAKGTVWLVLPDALQGVTRKGGAGGRRDAKGIAAAAVIDGALAHYGTDAGEVVTLDLERGRELMRVKVAGEAVHAPLVLGKGVLYGAAGKTLFAVDPKARAVLWTFEGEERFQPPVVADRAVYVAAGRVFYCLR